MIPFFLRSVYILACNTPSDINEHLPTLNNLATYCDHITEFGTGVGNSSTAFLNSGACFISYDIRRLPEAEQLFDECVKLGRNAEYRNQSTLEIANFEPTDLLFIDGLHTLHQVREELKYANHVKKWLVFHDTTLFGDVGEDGGVGIWFAIYEFLHNHPKQWELQERKTNNNGLTILKRKV